MPGTLTRLQMNTEVLAKLGDRSDLATRCDSWLDLSQLRLARTYDFAEMRKLFTAFTQNNQLDYTWPTNLKNVFDVRLMDGANSAKLLPRYTRFQDLVNPDPISVTTSRPMVYTPWGRCFELDPVPNAAYTLRLRCSLWPTLFTANSSVSDFEFKDEIIIELATAIGYASLSENEDAKVHLALAMEMIEGAKDADLQVQDLAHQGRGPEFSTAPVGNYWADPLSGLR